jgi:hypothetical protein
MLPSPHKHRRRWALLLSISSLAGLLIFLGTRSEGAPPKTARPADQTTTVPAKKKTAESAEASAGVIPPEQWLKAATTPLQPGEIDRLIARELEQTKVKPAQVTGDEQFIRRVTLDLTGQLPMPADVTEFAADKDPRKRAKLIDRLLDSEEYAQHWARYWRDVVSAKISDLRGQLAFRAFEPWMAEQLKKNTSWGEMVQAMLTASGTVQFNEPGKNGAVSFLASRFGADAAPELAAETSRVFLGIQIQCAQCHNHPSDVWKRQQFHELAAYFPRVQARPVRGQGRFGGFQLFSRPRGEYFMPDKSDPKKRSIVQPRFLTGEAPGNNLTDQERRKALADCVVNKKNYWFAAAFVNRIWGELLGQGFYQPVDDLGPQKEAVFPSVITRLAGAFQGSNYDIKGLFRAIMNSQTYQRQIRLGASADDHLLFAACYPTRLRADALWHSLVDVLGTMGQAPQRGGRRAIRFNFLQGFEGVFKQEFRFDPSLKADEVEHSVPQALLMMNSPVINQRIRAQGTNLLARILKAYPKDDDALRMVYLRTLSRKPTERELAKCQKYLKKVDNRAEAFEDILWALLNSTEFQTKR